MAKKNLSSKRQARVGERRLRDQLEQADSLMSRGRWPEAHQCLRDVDRAYPQRQEILRRLVETSVRLDDAHTYQYGCEVLYRMCPRDLDLPYMLTTAYLKNGWTALALSMARTAVAGDPSNERATETRRMLAGLEPLVNQQLRTLGLDDEDGPECLIMHDRIRSLLAQGRYAKAGELAEDLAKRRPRFAAAYNNGAEACFHDGRLVRAIELTQRLLAIEPDHAFALANLVRFLCAHGKLDEARRLADRLKSIKPMVKELAVKKAEALVWLGDDAGVLGAFGEGQGLAGGDGPKDDALLCHLAAVAAFRLGREDEARDCWKSALAAVPHFELARTNLDDLKKPVRERNAPWFYSLQYFVSRKLIDGLVKLLRPERGGNQEKVPPAAQEYFKGHPELEGLVPVLLDRSDRGGRELALHLGSYFRTPAMLQAMRDFSLGQRGSDDLRMRAAQVANADGPSSGTPSQFWLDGAWRAGSVMRFEIHGDPVDRQYAPGVADLVNKGVHALRTGDAVAAEPLLRRALAIDPDDPLVMNNLATACAQLGRTDEAETLSIRLHEKHPDYLFGRTALANLAAERGQFERARQLLEPLLSRTRLHFGEFSALCMAQVNLFLAEGKRQPAEQWLDMWRKAMPDHPALAALEREVRRLPRG